MLDLKLSGYMIFKYKIDVINTFRRLSIKYYSWAFLNIEDEDKDKDKCSICLE